jgi:hypothetical protein
MLCRTRSVHAARAPLSSSRPARTRRRLLAAAGLLGTLLAASEARAQYSPVSFGLQGGLVAEENLRLAAGPAFGVEGTAYVGSGFELVFRALASLHRDLGSGGTATGIHPMAGARFLLSEDLLRPYLGLGLTPSFYVGGDALPAALFGGSAFAGLEYYLKTNTAVGLQLEGQRALGPARPWALTALAHILWGY